MGIKPKWAVVSTVKNTRYEQRVYRDDGLGVQKEVFTTLRPRNQTVTRVFFSIDGSRAVYRNERDLMNAVMRGNHERRQSSGR